MPDEENRELRYFIEYKHSEIGDEEVNSLIKQTIEEVKKKNPEKAKALDEIEIKVTPLGSTLEVGPIITAEVMVILGYIICSTWKEIVIPMLKKKLNIVSSNEYFKKGYEKIGERNKE